MNNNLLRRPLPPLQKNTKSLKDNDFSKRRTLHRIVRFDEEQHQEEELLPGDSNLGKQLGPKPFFSTKWSPKKKPLKANQENIVVSKFLSPVINSIIKDHYERTDDNMEVGAMEVGEMEEEAMEDEANGRDIIVDEYKNKESSGFDIPSAQTNALRIVNIVNIDDGLELSKSKLRKPWRQIVLENHGPSKKITVDLNKILVFKRTHGFYDDFSPLYDEESIHYPSNADTDGMDSFSANTPNNLKYLENDSHGSSTKEKGNMRFGNKVLDVLKARHKSGSDQIGTEGSVRSYNEALQTDSVMREQANYFLDQDLTQLSLKARSLESVPELPLSVSCRLTWINLSFNDFIEIPSIVLTATNLVYLNMRNNPLYEIPDEISHLKRLKYLNLSFCCIYQLNDGLYQLKELEVLDISYNFIRKINRQFHRLTSLREFMMDGNRVRTLPKEFLSLRLSYFHCSSNFFNRVFWRESCPIRIQSLFELSTNTLINSGIEDIASLNSNYGMCLSDEKCDYCSGVKPMEGVAVLKPIVELFSNKNMPILFHVCSQTCRSVLANSAYLPEHLLEQQQRQHQRRRR